MDHRTANPRFLDRFHSNFWPQISSHQSLLPVPRRRHLFNIFQPLFPKVGYTLPSISKILKRIAHENSQPVRLRFAQNATPPRTLPVPHPYREPMRPAYSRRPRHTASQSPDSQNFAALLTKNTGDFQDAQGINRGLADLYKLVASGRLTARRAKALTNIASLLLRTVRDINHQLATQQPTQFEFIVPLEPPYTRPERSVSPVDQPNLDLRPQAPAPPCSSAPAQDPSHTRPPLHLPLQPTGPTQITTAIITTPKTKFPSR
jgi:hypothetical protein